jgi:capsule polysaccharide export protein KpsE/RkpR
VWDKEMVDAKEYVRKLNVISTKDKEETAEEPEKTSNAVTQKLIGCWSALN